MKQTCPTCPAAVDEVKWMCLACWRLVPAPLREDVRRTARVVRAIRKEDIRGPERAQRVLDAIAAYRQACAAAVFAVTERQIRREMAA